MTKMMSTLAFQLLSDGGVTDRMISNVYSFRVSTVMPDGAGR